MYVYIVNVKIVFAFIDSVFFFPSSGPPPTHVMENQKICWIQMARRLVLGDVMYLDTVVVYLTNTTEQSEKNQQTNNILGGTGEYDTQAIFGIIRNRSPS